jgi:hypothetical protein
MRARFEAVPFPVLLERESLRIPAGHHHEKDRRIDAGGLSRICKILASRNDIRSRVASIISKGSGFVTLSLELSLLFSIASYKITADGHPI